MCVCTVLKTREGISGYYRMLNKYGGFIWCQTRAHMMFDSRTGKPSYIELYHEVIPSLLCNCVFRPARAWFLEIVFVCEVGVCMCVSVCLCVRPRGH